MAQDFSYQLYSSRNFPPLNDTLKMLKAAGYTQVEGFGGVYGDIPGLVALLNKTGLAMPTGHFSIDMLENEQDKVFEIAKATGMKAIICPYLMPEDRPKDAAGWRALGARLQKAGEPYRKAGYAFGWHNHDFEFVPLADGSIPQDLIFEAGPDVGWEMDVAWAVRGKADPLAYIEKYGDRIISVHVKDIAPAGQNKDEDGWADVGDGVVGWGELMKALRKHSKAKYFVLEHDKPSDHKRFAERSIAAAKTY